MGRWTQEDDDDFRLPEGMKRTGYDADTGRYYFQDKDGSIWEGPEGAEFGEMRLVSQGRRASRERTDDIEAAPARADGYQALATNNSQTHVTFADPPNRAGPYTTLFPFLLIIAVLLLLAWRLLVSPAFSSASLPPACQTGAAPYWIQPGDSCWDIARRRGFSVDLLKGMNPGLECQKLMPGTTYSYDSERCCEEEK
ncbi:hypothetical protein H0H92_002271 [Tricholoma furcatifolium]|nr:hypothetical protein H0H92_002271 [Tricholoma furcatifolium]